MRPQRQSKGEMRQCPECSKSFLASGKRMYCTRPECVRLRTREYLRRYHRHWKKAKPTYWRDYMRKRREKERAHIKDPDLLRRITRDRVGMIASHLSLSPKQGDARRIVRPSLLATPNVKALTRLSEITHRIHDLVREGKSLIGRDVKKRDRNLYDSACRLFKTSWKKIILSHRLPYKDDREMTRLVLRLALARLSRKPGSEQKSARTVFQKWPSLATILRPAHLTDRRLQKEKAEMNGLARLFDIDPTTGGRRSLSPKPPQLSVWLVTPEQAVRIQQVKRANSTSARYWADCADEKAHILGADSRGRRKRIPWVLMNAAAGRVRFSLYEPVRGRKSDPETQKGVDQAVNKILENWLPLMSHSFVATGELKRPPKHPMQPSIDRAELIFTEESASIELYMPTPATPVSPHFCERIQREIRGCVGAFVELVFEALRTAADLGIEKPADVVQLALYEEDRHQGVN